jgi:3-isopropylmalate dehydrogenase
VNQPNWNIAVLPGDGIGPEVIRAAAAILQDCALEYGFQVNLAEFPFGGAAIDKTGKPLPQETLDACLKSDAVFLGAVGGPKWDSQPLDRRPEAGLLGLRRALGLYANVRPIRLREPLRALCPLRLNPATKIDFEIIRELVGDVYFGAHTTEGEGAGERAKDVGAYSAPEVERITRFAFARARIRSRRVTSIDKANVLAMSRLWRKTVSRLAAEASDITVDHLYVDNASMQIILQPGQFDVLLTSNLFGDILSDEAAALAGSIGMIPSWSAGDGPPLVEPIHGTAPQLVGRDMANPCGAILCVSLLLREKFKLPEAAEAIERSVDAVLNDGLRTADIAERGSRTIGGSQFAAEVQTRLAQAFRQRQSERAQPA